LAKDASGEDQDLSGDEAEVARDSVYDRRFQDLFGVSKDELIAQGVDPDVYMRENLRSALNSPKGQAEVLSESTRFKLRFFVYGKWFYFCIFAALSLLLVSGIHALASGRVVLISLSCVAAAAMIVSASMQILYAKRYRRACRAEGRHPHLYGKRFR
jgi:hypothetical protein